MKSSLTVWSVSRAQDAGYLALADISVLAAELGADYRIVGGHMVSLLVEAFGANGAPGRETADADFAAAAPVISDDRLLPALMMRNYQPVAGNRFVRTVGQELQLTIDVLVPSYTGRHEPNQPVGQLVVDAVPGLSLALARPGLELTLSIQLREPSLAAEAGLPTVFPVLVPDPLAALALKAVTWSSRHHPRDAVDVWRLLEVASAASLCPQDWNDSGVRGDARRILNDGFGRRTASGTRDATSAPVSRTRVASLVQQHVGQPSG